MALASLWYQCIDPYHMSFFFNGSATTAIYALPLHVARPFAVGRGPWAHGMALAPLGGPVIRALPHVILMT